MIDILIAATLVAEGATVQDAAASQDRSNRRICRVEESTGTRMSRTRVCRTAAEWEQERRQAERFARDAQDRLLEDPQMRGVTAPQ